MNIDSQMATCSFLKYNIFTSSNYMSNVHLIVFLNFSKFIIIKQPLLKFTQLCFACFFTSNKTYSRVFSKLDALWFECW